MPTRPASIRLAPTTALAVVGVLVLVVAGAYAVGAKRRAAGRGGQAGLAIGGGLANPLSPGTSQRLNLRLTNPYRFDLLVTKLTVRVAIDADHASAGCSATSDFAVRAIARKAYPIRVRAGRAATLRALGVRAARLPVVAMLNLPTDQNACRGARLQLRYSGTARRSPAAAR